MRQARGSENSPETPICQIVTLRWTSGFVREDQTVVGPSLASTTLIFLLSNSVVSEIAHYPTVQFDRPSASSSLIFGKFPASARQGVDGSVDADNPLFKI